ncbi:MAG TPA: hypothetical protein VGV35_01130 [Bryobacteraceae bacterium]|nr:hypothetical protein [Bryobacteraceae bacterium]
MRTILIRWAIPAVVLAIAWLLAGQRFTLLLDRFGTVRVASLPVSPLRYDGDFRFGELSQTNCGVDNYPFPLTLHADSTNRMILTSSGRSFILGPRTSLPDPQGRPGIAFVPDPGDQLSLAASHSVLSWPTPLERNFMTSHNPSWKRYLYYTLIWQKHSGANLEMLWRYEQRYYRREGWDRSNMMFNFQTGLIRVAIRPE